MIHLHPSIAVNMYNSKLFSLYAILVIFNITGFIEIKRTSSELLILCVIILKKCKIKHVNVDRHPVDTGSEATRISTSVCIEVKE